jgi:bifunctional DNA-binding transcriptional regulator/antitoxin component of YhaV-PrlF toxin-antitoxin module
MATLTVEMAQRGQVTIPKALREEYNWDTGQKFTMISLGNGVVVMSPKVSTIDAVLDRLRDNLLARGATLEDMLAELRRHREAETD